MDTLVLSLERLVMGANADLEMNGGPNAKWFAEELQKIFAVHPTRTGNVNVRVAGPDSIEVERQNGVIRVLKVASDSRSWELAATVNGSTPGQIAPILANL
jgi:hypothetical protein